MKLFIQGTGERAHIYQLDTKDDVVDCLPVEGLDQKYGTTKDELISWCEHRKIQYTVMFIP
jgi:hypothetical protein